MSDKQKKTVVIALGYFDSVHTGHRAVIAAACAFAEKCGCDAAVFTFKGNLKQKLFSDDEKSVFTISERKMYLRNLGIKEIYSAPVSAAFLGRTPEAFLDFLNKKYIVKGYVCGEDYRFGKNGAGDIGFLKSYAAAHGQTVIIADTLEKDGARVSTTRIKLLLASGEIEKANALIGAAYCVTGIVFEDRKLGGKIGFPTVNIKIPPEKFNLKDGVYGGHIYLRGKFYRCIINYGARPTFDLTGKLIEAHIADFAGDLYGRKITLYFDFYIRGIQKFSGAEELKKRLELDLKTVKERTYD